MAFIRTIKRENPFSQIDRFVFESDPSISWKAKGLMGYLLTRPDNWKINFKDLVKRAKDGREAVTSGLKELQNAGYIHYYQERTEDGKFGEWIYDVYERPEFNPLWRHNPPFTENPHSGFTESAIPLSEMTDYSNNKVNDNNLNNNNINNNDSFLVNKKVLINIANQYYQMAAGRWSKKQWEVLINKLVEDILNGEEYLTRVDDPCSYLESCLKTICFKHDKKHGKAKGRFEEIHHNSPKFYNWLEGQA
jgi:hypothetical protein